MPASSPILNLPLPAGSDAPDGPGDFLRFATDAEKYFVGQFASGAARDAAIPSGQRRAGMLAVIGSGASQLVTVYSGSAWQAIWDAHAGSTSVGAITAHKEPSGLLIVTGRVQVTIATGGTAASAAVSFPETFLSTPFPRVSLTSFSSSPSVTAPPVLTAASLSTTGVTVWANRSSTGPIDIDVMVVGRWK